MVNHQPVGSRVLLPLCLPWFVKILEEEEEEKHRKGGKEVQLTGRERKRKDSESERTCGDFFPLHGIEGWVVGDWRKWQGRKEEKIIWKSKKR